MKKTIAIFCGALFFVLFSLSCSAQTTEYAIGEGEGGLLNDPKIKQSFQAAADKFKDWLFEGKPSGYVTQTDDYYLQSFEDAQKNKATVYVGPDYNPYVFRGPIWEQFEDLGGFAALGRPLSDAYEAQSATWYQNFEKGYVSAYGTDAPVFVTGKHVDDNGKEIPLNDPSATTDPVSTDSGGITSSKTDVVTDSGSGLVSSLSDLGEAVEETVPKWGIWLFVILLVLAIAVLLIYWFLRRK